MGAHHIFTNTTHGDLAVGGDADVLTRRRGEIAGVPAAPWVWLRQVHGAEVVVAEPPGEHAGARADAVVTVAPGIPVAIHTADCAPLLIEADRGLAVAHVGWRGLVAGVIDATVEAMTGLGLTPLRAVLGPTIRPRCYQFGEQDLDAVATRFGDQVRSVTSWGVPALDLPAAVKSAADVHGMEVHDHGTCTACSPVHWSHRARGDQQRQALVAWLD